MSFFIGMFLSTLFFRATLHRPFSTSGTAYRRCSGRSFQIDNNSPTAMKLTSMNDEP